MKTLLAPVKAVSMTLLGEIPPGYILGCDLFKEEMELLLSRSRFRNKLNQETTAHLFAPFKGKVAFANHSQTGKIEGAPIFYNGERFFQLVKIND